MKILCIGDSLTEGDYGYKYQRGVKNVHPENYPYFLGKILGVETINAGKCGFTPSKYLEYYQAGNVSAVGADIVIIILGTNGGLDPDVDTQGNADYETLVDLVRHDAPDAVILVCTPPHVTENPALVNCGYAERVEKAVKWVLDYDRRRILAGETTKRGLIELDDAPMFNAENERIMQPNDGLHFGATGYLNMAEFIAERISPYLNDKK